MRQFVVKGSQRRQYTKIRKDVPIHEMSFDELEVLRKYVSRNYNALKHAGELWRRIKERERELSGWTSHSMRGSAMDTYLAKRREADAAMRPDRRPA